MSIKNTSDGDSHFSNGLLARLRNKADLTGGPLLKGMLSLGIPLTIGNLVRTTFVLVDMAFVGHVRSESAESLAALGISAQIMMLLAAVFMGISAATGAMVARAVGAKDMHKANHVATQAIFMTALLAGVLMTLGYFITPYLLLQLTQDPSVVELGTIYMRIRFIGAFPMLSMFVGAAILRGAGDTITPLVLSLVGAVLNIFLDPILIFGWFGLPAMGVSGAALATFIAHMIAFVYAFSLLTGGRLKVRFDILEARPDMSTIWEIVRIGIPNSVSMALRSFMNLVITGLVAPFGTPAQAAFTVGGRIGMLGFMPTFAIAESSATMVGQNLGAGKPDRARKSAFLAVGLSTTVMFIVAVACMLFAPAIVYVFNKNPAVISHGTTFLRIAVLGYMFAAVSISFHRSITGAGDTVPPMFFNIVTLWIIQVPLAWYLSKYTFMGIKGIWWAGVAAALMNAILAFTYFMSGRWMKKKI